MSDERKLTTEFVKGVFSRYSPTWNGADFDAWLRAVEAAVRADLMATVHAECDCVPDLGPPHCHACPGQTVWPCPVVTDQVLASPEPVEVYLTRDDVERLAHLLVQLSPATQRNSAATVRRLMREMKIKEATDSAAAIRAQLPIGDSNE